MKMKTSCIEWIHFNMNSNCLNFEFVAFCVACPVSFFLDSSHGKNINLRFRISFSLLLHDFSLSFYGFRDVSMESQVHGSFDIVY